MCAALAAAEARAGEGEPLLPVHRLVGLLEYVAADYGGAVQGGRVVAPAELEEQRAFVVEMGKLVHELPTRPATDAGARLGGLVAEVARLVDARAPEEAVAAACHRARDEAVRAFALPLAPTTRPDLPRAERLYATACAVCHGPDGGGARGAVARALEPPPSRFVDPARLAALSPYRAYNTLTFGVTGTSMPSFASLPAADRWSLAFFVFRLGHAATPDGPRGRALAGATRPTLRALASSTDAALDGRLAARSTDPGERRAALGYLRARAPFEAHGDAAPLSVARRLVTEALAAAERGDVRAAEQALIGAYLDGVEPEEAALRTRDGALVVELEARFAAARASLAGPRPGADLAQELPALLAALDRAEDSRASGSAGAAFAFVGGLVILLREGLEAALVVLALLAVLRRAGRADAVRAVHVGWLAALAVGGLTFALAGAVVRVGARRELVEGTIGLLAAAVLFLVSFSLVSQAQAQRWMGFLRERVTGASASRGALAIAAVAFLAVYREAVETALFYQALALEAAGHRDALAAGGVTGLVALVAPLWLLARAGRRLDTRRFFSITGLILYATCVVVAGKGLHALVEAGAISPRPLPGLPALPGLGLFPDAATLGLQGLLLVAFAAALALGRRRAQRAGARQPERPAPPPVTAPG